MEYGLDGAGDLARLERLAQMTLDETSVPNIRHLMQKFYFCQMRLRDDEDQRSSDYLGEFGTINRIAGNRYLLTELETAMGDDHHMFSFFCDGPTDKQFKNKRDLIFGKYTKGIELGNVEQQLLLLIAEARVTWRQMLRKCKENESRDQLMSHLSRPPTERLRSAKKKMTETSEFLRRECTIATFETHMQRRLLPHTMPRQLTQATVECMHEFSLLDVRSMLRYCLGPQDGTDAYLKEEDNKRRMGGMVFCSSLEQAAMRPLKEMEIQGVQNWVAASLCAVQVGEILKADHIWNPKQYLTA